MLASPEETAHDIWERVLAWSGAPPAAAGAEQRLPLESVPPPTTVWLEDKYDGIRCQLHKVGRQVALYSRDLKDITTDLSRYCRRRPRAAGKLHPGRRNRRHARRAKFCRLPICKSDWAGAKAICSSASRYPCG